MESGVYIITEMVHFGGFFQGDTVGLSVRPLDDPESVRTVTIDDGAWENLRDKHDLAPGMALELEVSHDEVTAASVLGSPDLEALRRAIVERDISPSPNLRAIAYRCNACGLWIAREPVASDGGYGCAICGNPLSAAGRA